MFESISTVVPHKFKKQVANELSVFLKKLRRLDESVTQSQDYLFLLQIKFDLTSSLSLVNIIQKCRDHRVSLNAIEANKTKACIDALIGLICHPQFKTVAENEATQVNAAPSPANVSLFFTPAAAAFSLTDHLKMQADSPNDVTIDKADMVRLLIAHTTTQTEYYHGFFIDIDTVTQSKDLSGISAFKNPLQEVLRRENALLFIAIDRLIENASAANINRIQIILKAGSHYTPIDIQSGSCFIFDAASDAQKFRLLQINQFSKYVSSVYDATPLYAQQIELPRDNLQTDKCSCHLFSLDQSRHVAAIPTLHDDLKALGHSDSKGIFKVDWADLPPDVIKNSQSTAFISHYNNKHPQCKPRIDELTYNNQPLFALNATTALLRQEVYQLCAAMPEHELRTLIEANIPMTAPRP